MTLRVGPIGSSSSATTIPGWNDYELMRIEKELLAPGVINKAGNALKVTERGAGANMTVDVAAGVALIEITNTNLAHGETYKVWFTSDAIENVAVPTADGSNPRIDIIIAKVDVTTDPDGSSANIATVELVEGTPAGSPSAPATPANSLKLSEVSVPASDTTITNNQITDSRVDVELESVALPDVARESDLVSIADGKGANMIGVEDAETQFDGDTVEEVLHELQDNLDTVEGAGVSMANIGFYGDGSDGAVTWSASTNLDPDAVYCYTTATLNAGQTLSVDEVNKVQVILNTGDVTINGTVNLNGKGAPGGAQVAGNKNGNPGSAGHGIGALDICGGGSGGTYDGSISGGGGGGSSVMGNGDAGSGGGGSAVGGAGGIIASQVLALLSNIFRGVACGGGGASSAGDSDGTGSEGGEGGGSLVWMIAGNLTLGADSVIQCNGVNGKTAGVNDNSGGGGGGSVLIVVAGTVTDNGVAVTATKGSKGGIGGNGKDGKVLIYSLTTGTLIQSS